MNYIFDKTQSGSLFAFVVIQMKKAIKRKYKKFFKPNNIELKLIRNHEPELIRRFQIACDDIWFDVFDFLDN